MTTTMPDQPNDSQSQPANLPVTQQQRGHISVGEDPFSSTEAFEGAQRMGRMLATASIFPEQFRNRLADCVIILDYARRMKMPATMVAQNINVIHGRPSWSATFIAAAINASGLFSPLRYEMRGAEGNDDWACRVVAYDLQSPGREKVEGPWVSIAMAKREGWYNRSGSKWQSMPEVMLRYRAISFFGKIYAPHILNGMASTDEIEDSFGAVAMRGNGAAGGVMTVSEARAAERVVEGEVEQAASQDAAPGAAGLNQRVARRRRSTTTATDATPAAPAAAAGGAVGDAPVVSQDAADRSGRDMPADTPPQQQGAAQNPAPDEFF